MTRLLLAIQFLSVVPIKIRRPIRDADLAGSMLYYPLVGAALGGVSALLYWGALQLFSPMIAVVFAVVGLVFMSGALHLDGWADTCDGFYGHRERKEILAIMRDSHSGAMAVVGVFCLLAMKIALLGSLEDAKVIPSLILAATLGRCAMVWLCACSSYARAEGGKASAYIGHVNRSTLAGAMLFGSGIAFMSWHVQGLVVMSVAAVFIWIYKAYVERRIGGMTGDTLGAASELVEVFALVLLSARWTSVGL